MARLKSGEKNSLVQDPDGYTLGTVKNHPFLTREQMDKFMLDNIGFASSELIDAWTNITSEGSAGERGSNVKEFVGILVKDYNKLKKELKMKYSEEELQTGVPDFRKKA